MSEPASRREMPELGSASLAIELEERLRIFDFDDEDRATARQIWNILEPEATHVARTHWEQWRRITGGRENFVQHATDEMVRRGVDYLRNRFTRVDRLEWVESAERTVAAAMAAGVPLTAILSMTGAGASQTLEILGRRHECSKEERHRINEVFSRLRSLECDIYASLFAAYADHAARAERDRLAQEFRDGIAAAASSASNDGNMLREQAASTSAAARGMLDKTSEVANAAAQSAEAMRDAAQTTAGLIRAIEEVREEVEAASRIATRAAEQAGEALSTSESLSEHARSIESILGLIRDIAGQTNLLALNATIEAARAGDAGRGFAVVAQEVKGLAAQTARAIDNIGAKITAIQTATRTTVDSNASVEATVAEVQRSADRIRAAMDVQVQTVMAITAAVDETALAADTMSGTIAAIRSETATVASEIDALGHGFEAVDGSLSGLHLRAGEFAQRVAA